jgi:hypothetical protein
MAIKANMGEEKDLSNELDYDLRKPDVAQTENQANNGIPDAAEVDVELSCKIDRKFDRHIIPWIFGIW